MILLTPGPCATSAAVRNAAALPDLNHRDPEFLEILRETRRRLLAVYGGTTEWVPHLLGGSGTSAVEALLASGIREGPVLVIENGYYSERIGAILEVHRIPHEAFRLGWLEPWSDEALNKLDQTVERGRFEAIVATHHETTVGRLNPIDKIAGIGKKYGACVLVDAMSSFGADPLEFQNLDAVVSSANKCLHGLPGVAFVLTAPEFEQRLQSIPPRTYSLHLPRFASDDPPMTPPVPAIRALHQALAENPGGQVVRESTYLRKIGRLRGGLEDLGFSFAVDGNESSCTLLSPELPPGWTFDQWDLANRSRGFVLYGCKGHLRERFFQTSVMGETTLADIQAWLTAVANLL